MARFCGECGSPIAHDAEDEDRAGEIAVGEITRADVRIAEINAERDIKLARIAAGVQDAERDSELARAEGVAEGMATVVEAAVPEPEPAPEPAPVVIAEDVQEEEPEMPERESSPMPGSRKASGSYFGF